MCCHLEAHAGALNPLEVSHAAVTLTEAIHGASAKLERAMHPALGQRKGKELPCLRQKSLLIPPTKLWGICAALESSCEGLRGPTEGLDSSATPSETASCQASFYLFRETPSLGPARRLAIYAPRHMTPCSLEIRIRGSFSRRGTQAANGSRL